MRRSPLGVLVWVLGLTPVGTAALVACADSDIEPTNEPDAASPVPADDAGGSADGDITDAACEGSDACARPRVDCTRTDFCMVTAPVSSEVSLNAIWGSSPNDIWAVGTRGTILHGDGTSFVNVPSGTEAVLFSVWGTASDDVWIAASRAPLHRTVLVDGGATWDWVEGETWDNTLEKEGRIWAIWGSSSSDVWIAGLPSQRFGGFGSFWSKGTSATGGVVWNAVDAHEQASTPDAPVVSFDARIRALWGSSAKDVWAVGESGQLFRYMPPGEGQSARWMGRDSQTKGELEALWGSSSADVWAVGVGGVIRHFSGASQGFDVVASPTSQRLHGIWGSGPRDIWAVGDRGTLIHYDGAAWIVADAGLPPGFTPDLFGIWGSGPDDIWIVGEGLVLHRTTTNRRRP